MNKFGDSECKDYKKVAGKIKEIVGKIREGTPLNQADAWIRDKHYTKERLMIDRLSGRPLSMDQCYVNLAIVKQSSEDAGRSKEGDATASPFSLFARQKVETPDKTMQVELATIFNRCKGRDGRTIQPRRILIRGRAGVGKTTLCKKIVHEFYQGTWSEWSKLFDRILWVPLRNLKLPERSSIPDYNLEKLCSHEYFALSNDGQDLAGELSRALGSKSGKTLFLLDGLDEVSQDLTGDGSMPRFLKELLNQPNVIITSRPSAEPPPDLDLELETIGFYPDQVKDYISKTFTIKSPETDQETVDQDTVDKIESFLDSHWLIQGLVRIPIQLDALCYMWEDLGSRTVPDTMTGIYNAIVQKLWKKDVVQLDKMRESHAQSADPCEIEPEVKTEIELLECLAFNGLYIDTINFTPAHIKQIAGRFKLKLPLKDTLARLSFLRTSDPSSKFEDRHYHFIHLTFQEYFAARYFVQQWKDGKQLKYVFNAQSDAPADPVMFLRKHKYTARYDIMWRFVAGLLDAEQGAETFFKLIEKGPLDLLGPTHQRLVMHCLSEVEVDSSTLSIRQKLETRLSQWLLFECELTGSSRLARESECPDSALLTALDHDSGHRVRILQALQHLGRHLSGPILKNLVKLLQDEDKSVRGVAAEVLGRQSNLSETARAALVTRLQDEDKSVRRAPAEALRRQSNLSETTQAALAARLQDEDENMCWAAAHALGGQSDLSGTTQAALVARLQDEDRSVRRPAAEALRCHSNLSETTRAALVARLQDQDEDKSVRRAAAHTLRRHSNLSEMTRAALVTRLQDEDEDMRWAAAEALGGQSDLSGTTQAALVARLQDEDKSVRRAAAEALGHQSNLSETARAALVARLQDEDKSVRRAAAEALGRQSNLSETARAALVARLQDEDKSIRRAAAHTLRRQSNLSETARAALVARLQDEDEAMSVRWATAETLGGQSNLSETTLAALAARLEDEDVGWAAVDALRRQSNLSETAQAALVARLQDEDKYVRRVAAEALGRQSNLSEMARVALVTRLQDEDKSIRRAAAEALGGQSNLLDKILQAIGLLPEPESQANPTFHSPQFVESLYGSLLRRSFEEQFTLYIDDGHSPCINQPSGLRTASFEQGGLDRFQDAVSKGRELWNISSYKLWDNLEGEDSRQEPSIAV